MEKKNLLQRNLLLNQTKGAAADRWCRGEGWQTQCGLILCFRSLLCISTSHVLVIPFLRLRHPETAIPLGHNDYSVFLVVDYTFNKSTRRNWRWDSGNNLKTLELYIFILFNSFDITWWLPPPQKFLIIDSGPGTSTEGYVLHVESSRTADNFFSFNGLALTSSLHSSTGGACTCKAPIYLPIREGIVMGCHL